MPTLRPLRRRRRRRQVFDDKSVFAEWFSEFVGTNQHAIAGGAADKKGTDAWFANEKRMLVITRLHQILEPFMLRRMVRRKLGTRRARRAAGRLPPTRAASARLPVFLHALGWLQQRSSESAGLSIPPPPHTRARAAARRRGQAAAQDGARHQVPAVGAAGVHLRLDQDHGVAVRGRGTGGVRGGERGRGVGRWGGAGGG